MVEPIFFNPWIWIVGLGVVLLLGASVVYIVLWAKSESSFSGYDIGSWAFGVFAVIAAGMYFGLILPPYNSDYYQTYRVTGEVSNVESAFSGDEGTMSQVFIAEVEGVEEFIRSDDQRFRTVQVGDDVNLVCTLEFRYFQEPWYECAFGGVK